MKRFLVIADDLSGTYDVGMQMKKKGLDVLITNKDDEIVEKEACLFNSETRNMNCKEAYSVIKTFISQIDTSNYNFIYKKIDSTLRGNICTEILAIDEIIKFDLVIVAPAYPALSRTVINEIVFLDGIPITKTDLALDPGSGVCKDNIKSILQEGLGEKVRHIDIYKLREDGWWTGNNDYRIISFDTVLDTDLDIIVLKYIEENKKILWVGSIGLMQSLLRNIYPTNAILSIVGSVTDISRKQIEYAEQRGTYVVFIDMKAILGGSSTQTYYEDAVRNLKIGNDVIICTSRNREDVINNDVCRGHIKKSREEIISIVNETLADIAVDILSSVMIEGVLITGGDTANCFIKKKSNTYPQLIIEVLPSVPLTLLKTIEHDYLKMIIKSGHVGEKESIYYCINKLKEKLVFQNKGELG